MQNNTSVEEEGKESILINDDDEQAMGTRFMTLGHHLSEIMNEARRGHVLASVDEYYQTRGLLTPAAPVILNDAVDCLYQLFRAAGRNTAVDAVERKYPQFFTE